MAAIIPLSSIYSMHHEGMSGDNPFILIARIQVKPGMVEDYLEIANDVDLITEQEEPGMLMHNFDQDTTDPLKFTSSEVYENRAAQ